MEHFIAIVYGTWGSAQNSDRQACTRHTGGQPSWGLSSEAAFFADLDDQELAEESERSSSPVPSSSLLYPDSEV